MGNFDRSRCPLAEFRPQDLGRRLETNRVTKLETGVDGIQSKIKNLVEAIGKIADMRGDIRVLDTRVLSAEQDIRELRHGRGFIRDRRETADGEYP
ncbi:hypothetical protein JQ581_30330 [Bradyrhizobium liaoningense]|uniref:hypothetical protein n=1 Tax=Bradyrhizobium liaoningense TaxID=43992 RepID=UPI001BAA30FC|nr:hypothetical protein [Bradyrhizobium liaoningense]MBR0741237.1 hypothetical protein [Bradyrhizobium liaoningense]